MTIIRYPIKIVAQRTGLTPHLIRVWEKRYATIRPTRSGGNQRLYGDEDIDRLILLKAAVEAGHAIRTVADLDLQQLRRLVGNDRQASGAPRLTAAAAVSGQPNAVKTGDVFLQEAFDAASRMDSMGLATVLDDASVTLGQVATLKRVIAPLVQQIGNAWLSGDLKVAHEHHATAVIRTFLGQTVRAVAVHPAAPVLLVTTPAGQLHELGAVIAAALASAHGWRVLYLGPSLPADEIVGSVRQGGVRAVALSIVHPDDDPGLPDELARLRRLLPPPVRILAGGRGCPAYRNALNAIGAIVCGDLEEFGVALDRLRTLPG